MPNANPDIYCIAQIIPRFHTGGGPSGASDIANQQGQLAYEVGTTTFPHDIPLSAYADGWYGWPVKQDITKADLETVSCLFGVGAGGERWTLEWRFNKIAGGHLWNLIITDNDAAGGPVGKDLIVHTDGYGRAGQSACFFSVTGESTTIQSNPTMGGSSASSARPGTDREWASEGTQQGASKGPRWSQGSLCVGFNIRELGDGVRKDVHILTVPLDFAPWGQEGRTRATKGCPLICDVWNTLLYENLLKINWPRQGIHTGFDRIINTAGIPAAVGPVSMRKSVLSMDCVDGFDKVYVWDGADGAKTTTLLTGASMHAAFNSSSSTGLHLHEQIPGATTQTWLYFFADLTNWPAGYADIGAQFRCNLTDIVRTAAAVTAGYPLIPNQTDRTGFVSAVVEGVYAVVRVSVAVDTTGFPFVQGAGIDDSLGYKDGTLVIQQINAFTEANLLDSIELSPLSAQKAQSYPYAQALAIPKNYITDATKCGGLIIKSDGTNLRARLHAGLGTDFCIGMCGQFPSGALGPLDPTDEVYAEVRYYWLSRLAGATLAQGPDSRSYSSLTWGVVQQPDGGQVPDAFAAGWNNTGRPHINLYLGWPVYWMCGTFDEVKEHMDWLYDNGWLQIPLPDAKYKSVP